MLGLTFIDVSFYVPPFFGDHDVYIVFIYDISSFFFTRWSTPQKNHLQKDKSWYKI